MFNLILIRSLKNLTEMLVARDLAKFARRNKIDWFHSVTTKRTVLQRFGNNKELWKRKIDRNSFRIWSGRRESNPYLKLGKLLIKL